MKLNFSIDVILGSCEGRIQASKEKNSDGHSNEMGTTCSRNENYSVNWQPPKISESLSKQSEEASTKISNFHLPVYSEANPSCPRERIGEGDSHIYPQHYFAYPKTPTSFSSFIPFAIDIATTFNPPKTSAPYSHESSNIGRLRFQQQKDFPSKDSKKERKKKQSHKEAISCKVKVIEAKVQFHQRCKQEEENNSDASQVKLGSKRVGRRLFSGFQILELEKAFSSKAYLTRNERASLAEKVNLTECQIKTWFQNRRTKEKRRGTGSEDDDGVTQDDVTKSFQTKTFRVPGRGVQVRPTYGPPDQYLRAAIADYLKRTSSKTTEAK